MGRNLESDVEEECRRDDDPYYKVAGHVKSYYGMGRDLESDVEEECRSDVNYLL
jgi:hypothetical protein